MPRRGVVREIVVPQLQPPGPPPEPTIAELAKQLQDMQASLKHADGEIAIARAEAKAARRSVETVSLQSQLTLAEVEADASAAKRQAESLQSQLDAIDVYKKSAPSFTDRGKEIQYNHNIGIVNDLTRALTALELGKETDVDKYIRRSITALRKRNKCLRIAEDSPFGWATVDEYLRSDLASDDEDDKKLKRAETAAEAKLKRASPRGKGRGGGIVRGGKASTSVQYKHADTCTCDNCVEATASVSTEAKTTPAKSAYNKQPMQCYYCDGPHMRVHCVKLAEDTAAAQAKIEAAYAAQRLQTEQQQCAQQRQYAPQQQQPAQPQ
jgi:DNA-binding protein YbaB